MQPGKSYRAVRTVEFNCRTSENSCVTAPIEAPLKSAVWPPKNVIFHTCTAFFGDFLVALRRFGGPGPSPPCTITLLFEIIQESRSEFWIITTILP